MQILCFGDSNTYGNDPRGYFSGRYDAADLWVSLMAKQTGHEVINAGANGSEIPQNLYAHRLLTKRMPVDIFLVMLDTNIFYCKVHPQKSAIRMSNFFTPLLSHCKNIMLILF